MHPDDSLSNCPKLTPSLKKKMEMDREKLSEAIWRFGQQHGFEEMAGVCARTLISLAHTSGGNELEFTCDQGKVNIIPEFIPDHLKN